MILRETKQLAESLIALHKVPYIFRFDNSRTRFGACHYGPRLITLSRSLVSLNSEPQVKDIILHEIAHALAGSQAGHNGLWKVIALGIGAKPEQCYSPKEVVTLVRPFKALCCGIQWNMKNNKKGWKCRKCHNLLVPVFNEKFALQAIEKIAARRETR